MGMHSFSRINPLMNVCHFDDVKSGQLESRGSTFDRVELPKFLGGGGDFNANLRYWRSVELVDHNSLFP